MGNDNKVKNIILVVLVIGLVGMTIAYAALTQQLVISDNEVTVSSNWNVHFAYDTNHSAVPSSTGTQTTPTATVEEDPELTATTISGLRATFRKPGDKVEFTFFIENTGDIDAKLASVVYGTPTCTSSNSGATSTELNAVCAKINYHIYYYGTTTSPAQNDDLLAGTANKRRCTLVVELDPSTQAADLPAYDVTVSNLTATFNYEQK